MQVEPKEDFLQRFGAHIKALREQKGISSAEMSWRCFVDRSNYTRIETGKTNPTIVTIHNLCTAMDILFKELFDDFKVQEE